jgi:hypothetical protein
MTKPLHQDLCQHHSHSLPTGGDKGGEMFGHVHPNASSSPFTAAGVLALAVGAWHVAPFLFWVALHTAMLS